MFVEGGYPGVDQLIKAYESEDADFHQTVAEMANIPRSQAKTINLGLFYGMGLFPSLNYIITIDKRRITGRIVKKERVGRIGGNIITIKEKEKEFQFFTEDIKRKGNIDPFEIGDKIEIVVEKGIFGILKNPEIIDWIDEGRTNGVGKKI